MTRRQLLHALRAVEARVLRVQHVGLLGTALSADLEHGLRKERGSVRELTDNAWCTGCPISRGAGAAPAGAGLRMDGPALSRAEAVRYT